MSTVKTKTQELAERRSDGIVDEQMETLASIKRNAERLLYVAMGVSSIHQIAYLFTLAHLNFATFMDVVHSIATLAIVFSVPAVIDFMIYMCIKVLGSRAIHRTSKHTALCFLAIPAGLSATINAMAPTGHILLNVAAVAPVVGIVTAEVLKLLADRLDLTALGEAEKDLAAQAGPRPVVKTKSRTCARNCQCGKHSRRTIVAEVESLTDAAPVEPQMRSKVDAQV